MATRSRLLALAPFVFAALTGVSRAQAPNASTYQGRLQESGLPVSGARAVEVRLCSALTGGSCFPAAGSATQGVTVANGVFKTTFTIPSGAALPGGRWFLEVAVGPIGGALSTLSPREELTAFPYAVYASSAATLLGTILPTQITAGLLDTTVIAQGFLPGGIGTVALATGAVTTSTLQDGAVDSVKLAAGAVDTSKILTAAVDTAKLASDAVTTIKIVRGAVDSTRIADAAIDSAKLATGAVSTSKMGLAAVDTNKLATDAVTTAKIADSAVTLAKLALNSVDASRLANSAVTVTKIAATSIDTTKFQPDAVTTSAILNFAVTLNKLAINSIDTTKIGPDAVTSVAILNGAVGTSKISLGAIDSHRLGPAAVTSEKFAAGALLTPAGRGLDGLGAMTRMGSVTGLGTVNLNIGARRHTELFIHIPPLLASTDVRIRFNGLGAGSYAVTRSTGGGYYTHTSASGIDLLGGTDIFPVGTQLHVHLTFDGNSGTPAFVTGSFIATGFAGTGFPPAHLTGSFGVNMGGATVTDISVFGVTQSLPSGTYIVAYGEAFP